MLDIIGHCRLAGQSIRAISEIRRQIFALCSGIMVASLLCHECTCMMYWVHEVASSYCCTANLLFLWMFSGCPFITDHLLMPDGDRAKILRPGNEYGK